MHADDDALHAFMDHELSIGSATAIEVHLGTCAECRARLADFRSLTDSTLDALRTLDSDVPVIAFTRVVARARGRTIEPRLQRWAAVALVAVTVSGLAIAAPRSPLRVLLLSLFHERSGTPATPEPRARGSVPALAATGRVRDRAGVTVRPNDSLRIEFARWQSGGDIAITLSDSALVTVRAEGGAAAFTTSSSVLGIDNHQSEASYDIQLPRHGIRIDIRVAGRRVYLHTGSSSQRDASPDSVGSTRIRLTRMTAPSQTHR